LDEQADVALDVGDGLVQQPEVSEDEFGYLGTIEYAPGRGGSNRVLVNVGRRRYVGEAILIPAAIERTALEYEEIFVNVARIYDLKLQQITLRTSFDVRIGDPPL